ncbi:MAG: sigma-70 family RNA polymerase sigma factor [Verrucomicrobiales bacterium]|nr:sigma-70 family RNA polymerase sigma factor [Verrucomicrobiales bacterium]
MSLEVTDPKCRVEMPPEIIDLLKRVCEERKNALPGLPRWTDSETKLIKWLLCALKDKFVLQASSRGLNRGEVEEVVEGFFKALANANCDKSKAEEAGQKVTLKFMHLIDKYRQKNEIGPGFIGFVITAFGFHLKEFVRERGKQQSRKSDTDLNNLLDSSANPAQQTVSKEDIAILHAILSERELKDDANFKVLNLYHFEAMSHQKIAHKLGITEDASRARLHRAHKELQKEFFKRQSSR